MILWCMLPEFSIYLRMNDSYFNLLQILGPPSKFYWEQFLNQMGVNIFLTLIMSNKIFLSMKKEIVRVIFFLTVLCFSTIFPQFFGLLLPDKNNKIKSAGSIEITILTVDLRRREKKTRRKVCWKDTCLC